MEQKGMNTGIGATMRIPPSGEQSKMPGKEMPRGIIAPSFEFSTRRGTSTANVDGLMISLE